MLLITERVIRTNGPLRREDPAPYGDLAQLPDLYAGDVRSSNFLFLFQESELSQLDKEMEKKTSNAQAGDKHILEYVRSNQKPEKNWKTSVLSFPAIREQEHFVRCYWPIKQSANFIGVTDIPLNELVKNPLKQGGESIGNHCIQKFYNELIAYVERYIDSLSAIKCNPQKLSITLAHFRSYWEAFVLANKGNGYFNPKNAEDALSKLQSIQNRVKVELEAEGIKVPFYKSWLFDKILMSVIVSIFAGLVAAYLIFRFGWNN